MIQFKFLPFLFLFFFANLNFGFSNTSIVLEDTIKPIPTINKEFLISVNVFLDKRGKSNFDSSSLASALLRVNQIFEPIKASFRMCEINYIQNFQYDTLNEYFRTESKIKYNLPNRINMYFAQELIVKTADLKDICGYASSVVIDEGKPAIVIKKGCGNSTTIAHEIGHFFGLPHTFAGGGSELVDGSNCDSAGDGICDTPSDPYNDNEKVSDYLDDNCLFINIDRKDAKGNFYDPDVSNIMSYYLHCTCLKFTRGQYTEMVNFYKSNPYIW